MTGRIYEYDRQNISIKGTHTPRPGIGRPTIKNETSEKIKGRSNKSEKQLAYFMKYMVLKIAHF